MKIGFSSSSVGIFPKIVRLVTRSKWSHCFVFTQDIFGEMAIIEASLSVQIVPFARNYLNSKTETFEIYELQGVSKEIDYQAQKDIYEKYSGMEYGFLELIYFLIKWTGLKKNPFKSGMICSELLYDYIKDLGPEYAGLIWDLDPDTTSAEDLYKIVIKHKDLFKRIA